jgi:hypothetical protein
MSKRKTGKRSNYRKKNKKKQSSLSLGLLLVGGVIIIIALISGLGGGESTEVQFSYEPGDIVNDSPITIIHEMGPSTVSSISRKSRCRACRGWVACEDFGEDDPAICPLQQRSRQTHIRQCRHSATLMSPRRCPLHRRTTRGVFGRGSFNAGSPYPRAWSHYRPRRGSDWPRIGGGP